MEEFYLSSHIDGGIAKLSELLFDVCCRLDKKESSTDCFVQFNPLWQCQRSFSVESSETVGDLRQSAHRILVWLGDLSRYRVDLGLDDDLIAACRFYHQAFLIDPSNGLPLNQLGTLMCHAPERQLEAVFYYLRRSVGFQQQKHGHMMFLIRLSNILFTMQHFIAETIPGSCIEYATVTRATFSAIRRIYRQVRLFGDETDNGQR